MPPRVHLELRGKFIPLPIYATAGDDLTDILSQLDVTISGKERLEWGIHRNSRRNDLSILEAVPRLSKGQDVAENLSHKILPAFLNGLRLINKKPDLCAVIVAPSNFINKSNQSSLGLWDSAGVICGTRVTSHPNSPLS